MLLESLRNNGVISVVDNSKTMSAPCGFTAVDLLGGTLETDTDGKPYVNRGVTSKFYMKAGQSGLGKSTLAIQSCCYGVDWWNKKYSHQPSDFIMFDAEDNTTIDRIMDLSGWSYEYVNNHFTMRKDVNLTDIYNFILKLVDIKRKNKDKYLVDSDVINIDGRPVQVWATTYVLIDSIAAVKSGVGIEGIDRDKSGEIKEAAISGNIDAMREAKLNTDFIMKIKPLCNQYGIYLALINHITAEQKMSMFDIPKRYLVALKPGEKLRGGSELIYQAYGIDRLTMKEKLDDRNPIYGDNVRGFIAEYSYIKSKNHGEGVPYRMVLDKRTGYKPELSDFEYLYSVNYGFGGSAVAMFMDVLPEVKFSRKTLLDKCRAHPELARAIEFTAKYYIINSLIMGNIENPDIYIISSLSLEDRLKYIYQYTSGYSGYGNNISEELEMALLKAKGDPNNDFKTDLSNSYLDAMALFLMTADEDCGPFQVPLSNADFITPYSDCNTIDEYVYKK
ncbi:MAG: hypothetical protein ACRC5M_04440 [Anaeroplasmataceae bacterium]